jgi:hypothetical protein
MVFMGGATRVPKRPTLTHTYTPLHTPCRFVSVSGRDVMVRVARPAGGSWADAYVDVERELASVMVAHADKLHARVRRSNGESVRGVLEELVESARDETSSDDGGAMAVDNDGGGGGGGDGGGGSSSRSRGGGGDDDTAAIAMHALLLRELDELGWASVVAVDLERVAATLTATDARGVQHHVQLSLPPAYPLAAPVVHAALPSPFAAAWPPPGGAARGGRLGAVLGQFSAELERHQSVWQELDVFDKRCWVLEPAHPTPQDVARRVVVAANTSVHVTLDPSYPRHLPECRFLGPDHAVGPLRLRFGQNASRWDPSKLVLDNLESALGVTCLPPTAAEADDFAVSGVGGARPTGHL